MYLHHNGNHTVLFLKVRALTRLSWAGEIGQYGYQCDVNTFSVTL